MTNQSFKRFNKEKVTDKYALKRLLLCVYGLLCANIDTAKATDVLQTTPTQASDPYDVNNNQYIDGESHELVYDSIDNKDVYWDGQNIYVKGIVHFRARAQDTLTVNVGEATSGSYVAVQPFAKKIVESGTEQGAQTDVTIASNGTVAKAIAATPEYGHLFFAPDEGGTIEVNLFKDLYLTGSNYSVSGARTVTGTNKSITPDELVTDLNMTFAGAGQTIFKFSDGKSLIMESLNWDKSTGQHSFTGIRPGVNAGVRVSVAMNQSKDTVVTKGRNKVVFQRMNINGGNTNCVVRVGRNSFFTYCSKNINGLDTTEESYAAVAFDVSNNNQGRFELQITGSDSPFSYVDGSMMVCGHFLGYMNPTDNAIDPTTNPASNYTNPFDFSGIDPASVKNDFNFESFTGIDFSQPAGSQAFLRVIDNLAYASGSDYRDTLNPNSGEVGFKSNGTSTRRGLLIINNNLSIPPLANNIYGDAAYFNLNKPNEYGVNNVMPYRPGFILGVNGHIEANHNTFLEYEALSQNIELNLDAAGFTDLKAKMSAVGITDPGIVLKKHNPSAFIIDGLETILRYNNPLTDALLDIPVELIKFQAHLDANIARHAQVTLYGNASFTCRAPLLANRGKYNGYRVPVPDVLNSNGHIVVPGETPGEGIHVMDIEGLFSIRSVKDAVTADPNSYGGWHTSTSRDPAGAFRLGSLYRTYDDREIQDHTSQNPTYITRPLSLNQFYSRYDKPSILANASFDFINLNFHNEDIARDIIADPKQSDPVILGGEKATFQHDVEFNNNPDIAFWRLYNSKIHCHESICITGTRLMVREMPAYHASALPNSVSDKESNISSIIFYNHGHAMDTVKQGHGRIFMLGSENNEVAATGTAEYLSSAYANIFRHTGKSATTNTVDTFKNRNVVLKLQTQPEMPINTSVSEKSMHMFVLGNQSYVDIGWTSTEGLKQYDNDGGTIYPFDHTSLIDVGQANHFIIKTNSTNDDGSSDAGELPAELRIDGDYIFFGARDQNGNGSPSTVDAFNLGRVVYVGHGGKMAITSDLTDSLSPRPYIGFSNATIATRVWKNSDGQRGLNPILNLPGDQMKLANPIHPYDIDMNVLTDSTLKYLSLKTFTGDTLGTEVAIAWDRIRLVPTTSTPLSWAMHSILDTEFSPFSRAITTTNNPVIMPTQGLLVMSAGDFVDQLSVSGATPANPFQFYMTGNNTGVSQVREITSISSDDLVPGEGDYAKIYLDGGAELGLGTRHWNAQSLRAWNRLGLTQVTLHPNGDCKIDVNNDLVIVDPQPLIPTQNFGSQYQATSGGPIISPQHRITFFSNDAREIRIPAGKELDLSAFGKPHKLTSGEITGTGIVPVDMKTATQQIAFGGKVKLIFEAGSTLRFPDLGDISNSADVDAVCKMPILYLNEESELIFEAVQDLENKADWTSLSDTNRARIRILGCGQIWLNKHAKMKVNDNAIVAIEADARTKNTNVTLSIQRESVLGIGDEINPGGSLQIGNTASVTNAKIDFTLRMNGEAAETMIGRNGFLGFGVGTVNRKSTKINNWTLSPLYNVRNVNIRNVAGTITHNRIFDGNNRESSLMALGPISGIYTMELGATDAVVRGGGNLLYTHTTPATTPFSISITTSAQSLVGTAADNGKYTILNPSLVLKQIVTKPTDAHVDAITEIITSDNSSYLNNALTSADVSVLTNGYRFRSGQTDFYKYLSAGGANNIINQFPYGFVPLAATTFQERIGYVINDTIIRSPGITMQTGSQIADGLSVGVLKVATRDANLGPTSFVSPGSSS